MIYSAESIKNWDCYYSKDGCAYRIARPLWSAMGRWRHAWWVLVGRCDAVWWPENGNPYSTNDAATKP
jgi:hypothetical protein